MKTSFRLNSASRLVRAFSLVETVLAIGIVSFALLPVFGMLPLGLNTFRHTVSNVISARIAQQLLNETMQTDYATLVATPHTLRYFDNQGIEVQSLSQSLYTAQISISTPTSLPNSSALDSPNLATVTVKLAMNPSHNSNPFSATSKISYSVYSALVAHTQ